MTIAMLERENLLVDDACNPNPNLVCLPQLSPQSSDLIFKDFKYLISYAEISRLLTFLSSYA